MANRAYLYAADSAALWHDQQPREMPCYDSRWTIPLAWWFLFSPTDVVLLDQGRWQDILLQTQRAAALVRFRARRPLLDSLLAGRLDSRVIDHFEANLAAWLGPMLLVDPMEVLADRQGDTPKHHACFHQLLQRLLAAPFDAPAFLRAAHWVSGLEGSTDDDLELHVIGYTYWAPDQLRQGSL